MIIKKKIDNNHQNILNRKPITNLEKNEPIKRNEIYQPNILINKGINKNNLNRNDINKEVRAKVLLYNKRNNFITHQNKILDKTEPKIFAKRNIIMNNKNIINKNKEINEIKINKNLINEKGMRNKPKLPELSDDIDSNIIKNEKIFAETTNNFYSKKIDFNNKELEMPKKLNDIDSNNINNEKIFNQTSRNFFSKNKQINNDDNILEKKIINEKKVDNKASESIENKTETKNKYNRIKKIRPYLSRKILYNKDFFTHQNKEPKIRESIEPTKNNNNILKEEIIKEDNKNIEINNKINDLNDDIDNLNINEIINQKNEEISTKTIDNNNENSNIINNKKTKDNKDESHRLRRINSFSNFEIKEKMISTPKYFKIYDKINIFNSILIMLNNNSIINDYFQKDRKQQIIECEKNNEYCLSSILYYLYKYLWYINNTHDIPQKYLIQKYNDFVDTYSETNYKNSNSTKENYCYEIKNIEKIIEFIYTKINREFSDINKKLI